MGGVMKIRYLVLVLLTVSGGTLGQAGANSNERGYRDCNLQHLEACRNTNQIFMGLRDGDWSHSYRKPELPAAIKKFLRRAPTIDTLGHSFSASEVVEESLTGPGNRFRFPTGEWFFSGFTPHYAPDQAAIIFDAAGHILLIATLAPDMSIAPKGAYGGYTQDLTIYLHTPEADGKYVERVVQWARHSVSERNKTYPELPSDEIGTIRIVTASTNQRQWNTRVL